MFYSSKVNFEKKKWFFPLRNFRFLYQPEIRYCYNTLLSICRPIICQVAAYRKLKTKENSKLVAVEVVAFAYERWSLARCPKYSDLTRKLLVFWKTGSTVYIHATYQTRKTVFHRDIQTPRSQKRV